MNGIGSLMRGGCRQKRQNLLRFSQDLSQAAQWGVNGISFTGGIVAPDGTTTAQQLVSSGSNKYIYQGVSLQPGKYSFSIWIKGSGGGALSLVTQQNGPGFAPYSSLATPQSGSWVRWDLAFTKPNDSNPNTAVMIASIQSSATVYVWGAQLNAGPMLPYLKTT
jgi:hypothetical protein